MANPTLRLAHGAHQKVISPIYVVHVLVLAWYVHVVVLCMVYMGKWTCKYGTLFTDWHFVIKQIRPDLLTSRIMTRPRLKQVLLCQGEVPPESPPTLEP